MAELRIFVSYFFQFLKSKMAYRADFLIATISNLVSGLIGLVFVYFLIDGETVRDLKGWSRAEVLFIYGYSMISMALFSTVAFNLYGFGDRYIIQGQFDRVLLRPLNSLCQVLFESFNLESIGNFVLGLVVLLSASAKLGLSFGVIDYLWLFFSSLCGAIILISVFIVLSSVSFHFEDRMGIAPPFYNLIAFGRYPLPIYNRLVQFILMWIVPFAFVAFFPATHFLDRKAFAVLCYATPLVALICTLVAYKAWQFGVSRYQSTGS